MGIRDGGREGGGREGEGRGQKGVMREHGRIGFLFLSVFQDHGGDDYILGSLLSKARLY